MRSPLGLILLVVALLLVGGFMALGLFPPEPRTEQIDRVLPNDRFRGT
jgi:hypothetical protein